MTADDYHYIGPDDIVDPPQHSHLVPGTASYFPTGPRHGSRADADNPNAPDILLIKHKNATYPLHFPAFAIGEGQLRVGDLRKTAAKEIGTDYRRIKLLYKGRQLRDDAVACREEGLKQNSELMCVVSEGFVNGREDDGSSESASESEMVNGGVRIDMGGATAGAAVKKGRKGHRGGKNKKRRDDSGSYAPSVPNTDSGYASRATNTDGTNSPTLGFKPPQPPLQTQAQQQPKSPMDKLEELSSTFHTKFVPQCIQFTNNPPNDTKAKDMEYKKLSESILAQIILKLDEVQTEGDEEARARRKALVRETQAMLTSLDAVMKK